MRTIEDNIKEIYEIMKAQGLDPKNGLPQELFIFISTLCPIANVDLLLVNQNEILLTWRDDEIYGRGWHIPGGCIRMIETMESRLRQTALSELGTDKITFDSEPMMISDAIVSEKMNVEIDQRIRGHNIAILYKCHILDKVAITNTSTEEHTDGYRKWFKKLPDDMLPATMNVYGDLLNKWNKGEIEFD